MHDIGAPAGDMDDGIIGVFSIGRESKILQDFQHGRDRQLSAQQMIDLFRIQRQDSLRDRGRVGIDDSFHHLTGSEEFDQFAGALDGLQRILRVQTFFIS